MEQIHLIGIGGTGLSAIARVLLERGFRVTGSDLHDSPSLRSLESDGATVYLGHHPDQIKGADLIVRSSAIPDNNVEVQAATSTGILVLKRSEFLGRLLSDKRLIAVAGTHGKTSTTAMIVWILTSLGQEPSFIVGGQIRGIETNAGSGEGPVFVIEADEYDRMFLGLNPSIAVITNVEHDHPDCFLTTEEYKASFMDYVGRLEPDGTLIACGDDPNTTEIIEAARENGYRVFTYGIEHPELQYRASQLRFDPIRGGFEFKLVAPGERSTEGKLQVPGIHNVQNAVAALAAADQLGLPLGESSRSLVDFRGAGRRFEIVGETNGITLISDYAHHPTEIKATLAAARLRFPDRVVWAVWQPHTYSRTRLMMSSFMESFEDAQHLVILEVYPSREPVDPGFSSQDIVAQIDHPHAIYAPSIGESVDMLMGHLKPGDVLVVLSAGDADRICDQVLIRLDSKPQGD